MIYDVILILIVIIFVVVNAHRGAARALAGIATSILAYFGATALGAFLSEVVYNWLLKPAITKAVADAVTNVSNNTAGSAVDKLPDWLTKMLNLSGEDLTKLFSEPLNSVSDSVTNAVENAVKPIAVSILGFFITIILFLLFLFIIRKLLIKPLLGVFEFPVIRTVNRFFGALLGLVEAFLTVSLLAYLLRLIIPYVGSSTGFFSESTIYNSFIFYHFYNGNIFSAILSLVS